MSVKVVELQCFKLFFWQDLQDVKNQKWQDLQEFWQDLQGLREKKSLSL